MPAVDDHRQAGPARLCRPRRQAAKRSDSSLLLLIWIRDRCRPAGRPACRRPQDAAVAERLPPHPLDRDAAQVGVQHPERAAVGDDDDLPAVRRPSRGPVRRTAPPRVRPRTRPPAGRNRGGIPLRPAARRDRPRGRRAARWPPGRSRRWRRPRAPPGTAPAAWRRGSRPARAPPPAARRSARARRRSLAYSAPTGRSRSWAATAQAWRRPAGSAGPGHSVPGPGRGCSRCSRRAGRAREPGRGRRR